EEWCIRAYEEELQLKKSFLGLKKPNIQKAEWMRFGGKETLKSFKVTNLRYFPSEYIEWMHQLEYYIELEDYYLVHAGFNFETDSIFDDRDAMLWIRDFNVSPEKINHKIIIHGHVPVSHEFIDFTIRKKQYHFIPLDNGVYIKKKGFGNLTAFEIKQQILLVQPSLDD
ncbi:MAG: hypothetical protein GYA75_01125, partial [Bacteroidales bacterium]|nr:hypothetical protein [Bacteroidales bacterium]